MGPPSLPLFHAVGLADHSWLITTPSVMLNFVDFVRKHFAIVG